MKSIVTNAAAISVLRLIDNTFKTGGGPVSIGATVIRAPKGPVGKVTQVTYESWERIFGKPYPKKSTETQTANDARTQMEGLRHLNDAAKNCIYVNVVRVVDDTARFPVISLLGTTTDQGDWAPGTEYSPNDIVTVTGFTIVTGEVSTIVPPFDLICTTAHTSGVVKPSALSENWNAYSSGSKVINTAVSYDTPVIPENYICKIYPIDGDPSINRSIKITAVNGETERFTILFYDKNELGEEYLLEYWTVGVNPLDVDDMGRSVFIETILEERSACFRCEWNPLIDWDDAHSMLTATGALDTNPAFTGGTNGGPPTIPQWIAAWDMFRDDNISAYLMFAAGCYDPLVLANCLEIAELRHTMFFMDIPCTLPIVSAMAWKTSNVTASSRFGAIYHCPIAALDEWYGGKTIWGASGAAVAACALGDANFSGEVPGIHYSPAGQIRGRLSRVGIEFINPGDVLNRDDLYTQRINPIVPGPQGGAIISDSLTIHTLENYSRFIWVNRIENYIDHRFFEMASALQHEPDRITLAGLTRGMDKILGDLVISGALSRPRAAFMSSPYSVGLVNIIGNNPYVFSVEQPDIDRWLIKWEFCPTGSARRIIGQPIMIL